VLAALCVLLILWFRTLYTVVTVVLDMNYGVVMATTQVISSYEQQHKSIRVIDGQTSVDRFELLSQNLNRVVKLVAKDT